MAPTVITVFRVEDEIEIKKEEMRVAFLDSPRPKRWIVIKVDWVF